METRQCFNCGKPAEYQCEYTPHFKAYLCSDECHAMLPNNMTLDAWGRRGHRGRGPILSWPLVERKRYYKPWKTIYPGWYRKYKYGRVNPIFWLLVDRYPPEHAIWHDFDYYEYDNPRWDYLRKHYLL